MALNRPATEPVPLDGRDDTTDGDAELVFSGGRFQLPRLCCPSAPAESSGYDVTLDPADDDAKLAASASMDCPPAVAAEWRPAAAALRCMKLGEIVADAAPWLLRAESGRGEGGVGLLFREARMRSSARKKKLPRLVAPPPLLRAPPPPPPLTPCW